MYFTGEIKNISGEMKTISGKQYDFSGEIKDVTVALISGQQVPLWKGVTNELGMAGPTWLSVITSFVFGAAIMAYCVHYFSKKDY